MSLLSKSGNGNQYSRHDFLMGPWDQSRVCEVQRFRV